MASKKAIRVLFSIILTFCFLFLCGCSNEENTERPDKRQMKSLLLP